MAISAPGPSGMRRGRRPALSDINVTPLVDVVLVLLIIFMVTAPMMQRGVDVRLPRVESSADAQEQRLVVTVGRDQKVYLNDKLVPVAGLEPRLRDAIKARADKTVYLKADQGLSYGFVVETMDRIRRAGVEKLGMVTEPARER